jgi:hypothetical protein
LIQLTSEGAKHQLQGLLQLLQQKIVKKKNCQRTVKNSFKLEKNNIWKYKLNVVLLAKNDSKVKWSPKSEKQIGIPVLTLRETVNNDNIHDTSSVGSRSPGCQ